MDNIRRCWLGLSNITGIGRGRDTPSRINMVQLLSHVLVISVTTSSSFDIMLLLCYQKIVTVNWNWVFIGVVKPFNGGTRNAVMDITSKWIQQRYSQLLCSIACEVITLTPPLLNRVTRNSVMYTSSKWVR